jgi:hypothetical protein
MTRTATARLQALADDSTGSSLSHRLRARRFERFEKLTADLDRPLSIIDIGGTNQFWEQRGWAGRDDVEITLVNLVAEEDRHPNIHPTVGDATALTHFADDEFDIAFSNSVIEHLFNYDAQTAMAAEVRRVARAYWVQTPNFWFPMEPHFLTPAWHWLPVSLRVEILRRRPVGWMGRVSDPVKARQVVEEVRLMRRSELGRLFPGATLVPERLGGLVKSWTAIDGFSSL